MWSCRVESERARLSELVEALSELEASWFTVTMSEREVAVMDILRRVIDLEGTVGNIIIAPEARTQLSKVTDVCISALGKALLGRDVEGIQSVTTMVRALVTTLDPPSAHVTLAAA